MNTKAVITFYFSFDYYTEFYPKSHNLEYIYQYPYESYEKEYTKRFDIKELEIDTNLKNDIISWNKELTQNYSEIDVKGFPLYDNRGLYYAKELYKDFIEDYIKNTLFHTNYKVRYYYTSLNNNVRNPYRYTLIKYIPSTLIDIS